MTDAEILRESILNDSETMNLARLYWHIFKKGIQVGSVIGCAVVAPYTISMGLRRGQGIQFQEILKRQVYSLVLGVGFSTSMLVFKYLKWENKKLNIEDRVYRIAMNSGQNRVDFITSIAFAGALVPGYLLTNSLMLALGATSPAVALGIAYHVATKPL